MSGSTIGGFAGAIVGSFFGMPQLGFMIGSAIGGYLDPQRIEGPRLKDASVQTSQDGVPIPFGYGVFPCAGNVIWRDKLVEHKKKGGGGKGGGPSVTEYRYTRSYAIGICQGPITGILMIKRNGKNVYDARSPWEILQEYMDASDDALEMWANIHRWMAAMRRRFMNRATIYFGTEDQMPDPTIESVVGVGNVSAFRGLAYMVVKDDDLTDTGGAIPQYEFVVAQSGQVYEGEMGAIEYPAQPWAQNATSLPDPRKAGITYEYRFATYPMGGAPWRETLAEAVADGVSATGMPILDSYEVKGWSDAIVGSGGPAFGSYGGYWFSNMGPYPFNTAALSNPLQSMRRLFLMVSRRSATNAPGSTIDLGTSTDPIACSLISDPQWVARATWNEGTDSFYRSGVVVSDGVVGYDRTLAYGCTPGGQAEFWSDFIVEVRPKLDPANSGVPTPDAPGYYVQPDGSLAGCGSDPVYGSFRQMQVLEWADVAYPGEPLDASRGPQVVTKYPVGPAVAVDSENDNETWWTAQYDAAVLAGTMPSGLSYGVDYPKAVDVACPYAGDTVTPEGVPLATIVANLVERAGLTAGDYDVSQLTDLVTGYRVATEAGAGAMIAPLQQAYFFDVGEWDGKLRFVKRGGNALYSIGPDDFVERDGDPVELERVQEAELLRRVTVGYIDPRASYTGTTQKAERRAGTIEAKGEGSVELPIVADADDAATMAKKRLAVAWSETDKLRFTLSQKWAKVTPADVCEVHLPDGNTLRARVMSVEEDSGRFEIEAIRDRQAAYTGTATGVRPPPPTITDPPLIGPTRLAVMDLPVLAEADDALGVYVAARGYLPGWSGAEVQLSTDSGATYSPVTQVTQPATIGYTTTSLSAWHSAEYPSTQSVTVYLPDAPESITYEALLRYGNRAALQLDDGTWEVLQYQTVVANGNNSYTLSGLLRGRYNTTPGAAASGATFVLLDGYVGFVPCERWMLDQTFKVRAVSYGTNPDAVTGTDFTLTGASQIEWPPHDVQASRDGSDSVTVTWVGRARLGTETTPFHSQHFTGYRVTFSDGHTADVTDTTYTRSSTPPGVTVSVAALNAITGAGPSSETVNT